MSKRKNPKDKPALKLRRYLGNALYVAVIGVLLIVALWSLRGHFALLAASSGDSATNPIGVVQSSHPTDTDIASLQAAERAQFNQPALVWFHADW